jgi:hypothetical protein
MKAISCSSIVADEFGLHETDHGKKFISIPWAEIDKITLTKSFQAERPLFQTIISLILILVGIFVGVYPLYMQAKIFFIEPSAAFARETHYSPRRFYLFASMATFVPFGLYILISTVRRRFCLEVKIGTKKRKLFFNKPILPQEAVMFSENISQSFNCHVGINPNLANQ